ncbi:hypothetical protein CR513_34560, partial [Mucuna pruriens]
MGYVLRVRLASFFAGAATASFAGLYILHRDYKVAHQSFAQQMNDLHQSLESRISSLEKLKQTETSEQISKSNLVIHLNHRVQDATRLFASTQIQSNVISRGSQSH